MKKNIFTKLFLSFFSLALLVSVTVFLVIVSIVKNFYIQASADYLANLGSLFNHEFMPLIETIPANQLQNLIEEKGSLAKTRITIVDPKGNVLADSEKDPRQMDNHSDRYEIRQALADIANKSIRFSKTIKESLLYYAMPMKKDGRIIGVLRLSIFLKHIESFVGAIKLKVLVIIVCLLIVSLVISFFLARHFSWPIRRLTKAAQEITAGQSATPVILKQQDELRELAEKFNEMVQIQQGLIKQLKDNEQELTAIIGSISDGLLVIDSQGVITCISKSFNSLFPDTKILDKHYYEVIRQVDFDQLVQQARNSSETIRGNIEIQNMFFNISLTMIPSNGSLVIGLHDISELKSLEKIKKDFIMNVSHELRTPLTSIKGFIETLGEEMSAENKKYLQIISRNTDRLIALTNDLLSLAQLEEKRVEIEKVTVDLTALITHGIKIFEKAIQEKKLELKVDLPTEPQACIIMGDPFRMEQMLINLLDNAVKYTEQGKIHIRLQKSAVGIILQVSDTGIGIASEHQARIFERFYVVNKARSRESGGTGLGLSIVKHIVLMHGGQITVESKEGTGTTFTITLPCSKK